MSDVPQEVAMRTRTRQVVRMLADMRHAAHCRALRSAATQEAMRLADEEARAEPDASGTEPSDTASDCRPPSEAKARSGFH